MGWFAPSASVAATQRARDLAAAGRDIIALTVGEPDFDTPEHVREAAVAAMARGDTRYTNVDGTAALKQAIVGKFHRENGIRYDPSEVIAAAGAKQLIFNAFMATIDEGDEVVIPTPCWVSYPEIVKLFGGRPVMLPCHAGSGFKIDRDRLSAAITPRTRWVTLNSPNNPSGAVYTEKELRVLGDVLLKHPRVLLMSDDIYVHPTSAQLRAGGFREITERITVCVATDGNQGRGLAYGARIFGCRCVIYIHGHVSPGRKEAMEKLGAIVIRIDGEYEASVARAKEDARINGWHFVSSTSWDDFHEDLPRDVMSAYMVMVEEALTQIPEVEKTTHVFMSGGGGSIAAAVFMGFHQRMPGVTPRFVVVEPSEADCLLQSAVHDHPVPSPGSLRTIMAGLACREVSPAAWNVLSWLGSDFVTIPDEWAVGAMRALADGGGDAPIVSGESACGGMGVLIQARSNLTLRDALGLNEDSRVVLFGCEGATDPAIYEEIVGKSPALVFAAQTRFASPDASAPAS